MTIDEFVTALNEKQKRPGESNHYFFEVEKKTKYDRVMISSHGSRSVYCFVDHDGNIFKAAGAKAPAKTVRSTLATVDIEKTDPYGSWLYR
jgi:hypothetical protein